MAMRKKKTSNNNIFFTYVGITRAGILFGFAVEPACFAKIQQHRWNVTWLWLLIGTLKSRVGSLYIEYTIHNVIYNMCDAYKTHICIYTIHLKTDMFLPKNMCDIHYTILGCCLIIHHPKNNYGNLEEASEFLNTPKYQIVSYISHSVPIKCVGFPCFPMKPPWNIIFSCPYQLLSPSGPGSPWHVARSLNPTRRSLHRKLCSLDLRQLRLSHVRLVIKVMWVIFQAPWSICFHNIMSF